MPAKPTTLSIFGLENVLVKTQGKAIASCKPNPVVSPLFRSSVGNSLSATVVISSQEQSLHSEVFMWLQKHYQINSGPQPTYIMMRVGGTPATVSSAQNLKVILSRHAAITRIECVEHDLALLSMYRELIQAKNILFWRLNQVNETSVTSFASSFIDRG